MKLFYKERILLIMMVIGLGMMLVFSSGCSEKERDNPLDPGANLTFTTNVEDILIENFEYTNSNTPPPSPYLYAHNTMEGWLTPIMGYEGTKSLRFSTGTMTGHFATVFRSDISFSGEYTIEFFINRATAPTAQNNLSFKLTDASGINVYLEAGINQDNRFYWSNGTSFGTGVILPHSNWKMIKLRFNTIYKKFSVWYGDPGNPATVLINDGALTSIPDTVSQFQIESRLITNGSYTIDFDNLKITKYTKTVVE
ncbi:MAG: hypothetical protein KKH98_13325 [Spirochaetes bacterium]|nr:hypothetical protein [Spirochaetota bacterium]